MRNVRAAGRVAQVREAILRANLGSRISSPRRPGLAFPAPAPSTQTRSLQLLFLATHSDESWGPHPFQLSF